MIEFHQLPPQIQQEAGDLLRELRTAGWEISAALYESSFFGDWFVDLQRDNKCIRLMKENALFTFQNLAEPEPESEEASTFDSFVNFHRAVSHWIGTDGPALVR